MTRTVRDQQGFTLIELLVVVLIIGVLAAVALPTFLGQRTKAQDAEAKSNVRNLLLAGRVLRRPERRRLHGLLRRRPSSACGGSPGHRRGQVEVTGASANGYTITAYSESGKTYRHDEVAAAARSPSPAPARARGSSAKRRVRAASAQARARLTTTRGMASLRRLRRRLASEGGSLLVEVLVSASILLTVSAGVVLVLMTSDAQSSLQRSKALATDVAQTKLDALRAIGYNDLRPLSETTTVTEGGVDFTVVSTATPVAQTDAPTGCLTSRARDYMSLKATVTWAEMGPRKPVVLQTMVAAPIGAGGGLVVSVTGAPGQAVPNIPITLSSGGGSATTDATGCARWDAVSAGSGYSLSASVPGYVQPNGQQDVNITGLNIAAEETAQKSFAYDRGGSVRLQFLQKTVAAPPGRPSTPTHCPPTSCSPRATASPSRSRPSPAPSARPGSSTRTRRPRTRCTPTAARRRSRRPARRPRRRSSRQAAPCRPRRLAALQLPNLNVRVVNGNTGSTKIWVKTACGTIIGPRAIVADGTMKNPGLPYGTGFTVCAVDGAKKVSRTVDNTSYSAPSATTTNVLTLPLVSGGSCPFATT